MNIETIRTNTIDKTLGLEGGYSNKKYDSGGETRFGITIKVARKNGYQGKMKSFPLVLAKEIYVRDYWDKMMLDDVCEKLSLPYNIHLIVEKLFDCCVNTGVVQTTKFLQRAINLFSNDSPLKVDGKMGNITLTRLSKLVKKEKEIVEEITKCINCQQGMLYMTACNRVPANKKNVKGWFRNRIS